MMAKYQRDADRLLKLLVYILGRRPDEFGLVPDDDGFVKTKELIKAIVEEEGWGHIRKTQIDALFITLIDPPLEREGSMVRARQRDKLPSPVMTANPPRLLFTCVRKRAYRVVHEKGVLGMGGPRVILSSNRDMARRIGRRYDHQAILLTVNTRRCMDQGIQFYSYGGDIFWTSSIPPNCFSGPPLPEETPSTKKAVDIEKTVPTPGTSRCFLGRFFLADAAGGVNGSMMTLPGVGTVFSISTAFFVDGVSSGKGGPLKQLGGILDVQKISPP